MDLPDELKGKAAKPRSPIEVDQGYGVVHAGTDLFGDPIYIPRSKCEGCEEIVSEPVDCPLCIEQCCAFGVKPDVDFVREAMGLPPIGSHEQEPQP